jgi:hypothetical protein
MESAFVLATMRYDLLHRTGVQENELGESQRAVLLELAGRHIWWKPPPMALAQPQWVVVLATAMHVMTEVRSSSSSATFCGSRKIHAAFTADGVDGYSSFQEGVHADHLLAINEARFSCRVS